MAVRSHRPSARRRVIMGSDLDFLTFETYVSKTRKPRPDPMHRTLPRHFYADPDFYRAELTRFYVNRWICAGRADQIPSPGDFFTRAIADESVIVTRDKSGEIHALFNVC